MIHGIGADILRVSRIERVYARHGSRFLDHILHPQERAALARQRKPALYLAKCFAAKEAFVKALGSGFVGVAHDEIGSTRSRRGRPSLVFGARLRKKLDRLGIVRTHLSLSDDGDWICAMVVLEGEGEAQRSPRRERGKTIPEGSSPAIHGGRTLRRNDRRAS